MWNFIVELCERSLNFLNSVNPWSSFLLVIAIAFIICGYIIFKLDQRYQQSVSKIYAEEFLLPGLLSFTKDIGRTVKKQWIDHNVADGFKQIVKLFKSLFAFTNQSSLEVKKSYIGLIDFLYQGWRVLATKEVTVKSTVNLEKSLEKGNLNGSTPSQALKLFGLSTIILPPALISLLNILIYLFAENNSFVEQHVGLLVGLSMIPSLPLMYWYIKKNNFIFMNRKKLNKSMLIPVMDISDWKFLLWYGPVSFISIYGGELYHTRGNRITSCI